MVVRRALLWLALLSAVTRTTSAAATEAFPGSDLPDVEAPEPEGVPEAGPARPAPYSLPWHLRSAVPVSGVRSDTVVAFQDVSRTTVTFLSASLKVAPDVAFSARYGWVHDASDSAAAGSAFTNLGLAGLYAPKLSAPFRVALSGGFGLPVAQGGGDTPDRGHQTAIASGAYARSAMDNAMFGPNDLSLLAGVALAYIEAGFTVQLEGTIIYGARVKGEASQPDKAKANTTWSAHLGYYLLPELSVGAELRYQDFLVPPRAVTKAPARRDAATVGIGLRAHLKLGALAFHPGVSYGHPLDEPMSGAGYRIVQLDLPLAF